MVREGSREEGLVGEPTFSSQNNLLVDERSKSCHFSLLPLPLPRESLPLYATSSRIVESLSLSLGSLEDLSAAPECLNFRKEKTGKVGEGASDARVRDSWRELNAILGKGDRGVGELLGNKA